MRKFICIDIGGTSIKYSVTTEEFEILSSGEIDTNASKDGGEGVLQKSKNIISNFLKEYSDISGVCMSSAGLVDNKKGEIIYAYEKFIPNYSGMKLKEKIENAFGIRCEVENDVNCAGLCEVNLGAGKGKNPVVCLTIGTGIGGCVVIDGKVLSGFCSSAGEVGYFKLKDGHTFQDLASTTSLVKRVADAKNINISEINGRKIFEMAKNGDKDCLNAIDDMAKHLAWGISVICTVVNPEMVILGGGVMAQEEIFAPKIKSEMEKILIPMLYKNTTITFAKMKNNAGMFGALQNFLQKEKNL